MARIVRGNWTTEKFDQNLQGELYGVFDEDKMVKVFGDVGRATEFLDQYESEQRKKEVERSREQASKQDQEEQELRKAGVIVFTPSPQESKAISEAVRIAAMAKTISKSTVSIPIFKDGKVQVITEEIGNYDWILQVMLSQRRNGGATQ